LALLDIEGLVATIDAIGRQKEIVSAIVDKKADYVLAVKDNQPHLHEDIRAAFSTLVETTDAKPGYCTHERGHGREETRRHFLSEDLSGIRGRENWRGLRSIGMAVSERKVGDKESVEVRYYISSLSDDPGRFGKAVRNHWGVENGLHWVLDIAFDEYRNRIRKESGAENLSTIRRIALNPLRDCKIKSGVKGKRIRANADCGIREQILNI
jgi:predicted transposase YbfD/YdcC